MNPKNHHSILLVDDDTDDIQVLQEALLSIDAPYNVIEVHNGEEAMKKLYLMDMHDALPSLIILDINMPRMDGKQTVAALKRNEKLSNIPVVVFSTSSNRRDEQFFSSYGVKIITKPFTFSAFPEVAAQLLAFCSNYSTTV